MLRHGPSFTAGNSRRPPGAPGSGSTGPAGSVPRPGWHESVPGGNPPATLAATVGTGCRFGRSSLGAGSVCGELGSPCHAPRYTHRPGSVTDSVRPVSEKATVPCPSHLGPTGSERPQGTPPQRGLQHVARQRSRKRLSTHQRAVDEPGEIDVPGAKEFQPMGADVGAFEG